MRARHVLAFAALLGIVAVSPTPAYAGHHLWRLTQLFSNASGSIQFVQLFVADANEAGVGPFTITASGHTFNFVTNLPSAATANTWILVGTPSFASAPGAVTPDYIMPANFFATGGGTIAYAGAVDTWNYGTVPTDGAHSLMRDGTTPVNTVKNFAGQAGAVVLAIPAPALTTWGIVALVGTLLLIASGLLRRRNVPA